MDEIQLQPNNPLPIQPEFQTSMPTSTTPVKSKNVLVLLLAIITLSSLGLAGFFGYKYWRYQLQPITTYEECVKANGNQTTLMFPGTCTTRDGRQFTEPLTDEEKKNLEPPTDPTANWKTYTNDGFSIQYPSEWKINLDTNSFKQGDAISIYKTVQYNAKVSDQNFLFTAAKPVQTTLGLRDWIDKENILAPNTSNEAPKLSKDATLGEKPAIRIDGCGDGCFTYLYTKFNDKIYAIVYPSGDRVPEDIQKSFDQILSTFKFTDVVPKKTGGAFCGGFAGTPCPSGYTCKLDGNYPDAGGLCEK